MTVFRHYNFDKQYNLLIVRYYANVKISGFLKCLYTTYSYTVSCSGHIAVSCQWLVVRLTHRKRSRQLGAWRVGMFQTL